LLSLLVIPAVFTGVDDIGQWLGRMLRRARGLPARAPQPQDGAAPSLPH